MPGTSSLVGAMPQPLAAGVAEQAIVDPLISGLVDFVAFWIKSTLDARLANHTGINNNAIPDHHRFTFDPMSPQGHSVRIPVPALYLWWSGASTRIEWSTIYDLRQRELSMMWICEELPGIEQTTKRAGMLSAVDAALMKAGSRQRHPDYTPTLGGKAIAKAAPGMPLYQALGELGSMSLQYNGGQLVRIGIDDENTDPGLPPARRRSGRDFPALLGVWLVREKVLSDELAALAYPVGDRMPDIAMAINASDGESEQTAPFMDRILGAPDGSNVIAKDDD
jgi:hypothetical protein